MRKININTIRFQSNKTGLNFPHDIPAAQPFGVHILIHGAPYFAGQDDLGLQNFMLQSAYVMVDFDNDGDLDMLANTISGPVWFYKNNDVGNNAIVFEFRDKYW